MTTEPTVTQRKLVRDLMTVGVPTCPPHTPIVELTRLMLEKNWEAVVVLDGDEGHAIGVVSQDELVKMRVGSRWKMSCMKACRRFHPMCH